MKSTLWMGFIALQALFVLSGCKEQEETDSNTNPGTEIQEPKVTLDNGGSDPGEGGTSKTCFGISDYVRAQHAFGKNIKVKDYNHLYDFDKNGVIDDQDISVIKHGYCGSQCFSEEDYAALKSAYGNSVGDCDYTTDWDFNSDGKIDHKDLEDLKNNYCP